MFSRIHSQFGTTAMILSIAAMILALGGGAYAANNATSSKAKAGKPGPRGKTGPAGPAGPAGPTGPAGSNGTNGTNGSPGTPGANGKSVVTGNAGSECANGGSTVEVEGTPASKKHICNGTTGFTKTLPVGETETGDFITPLENCNFSTNSGCDSRFPVSFPIPLPEPIEANHAYYVTTEETEDLENQTGSGEAPAACPATLDEPGGTVEDPKAEKGYLCLYQGHTSGAPGQKPNVQIFRPGQRPEVFEDSAGVAGAEVNSYYEVEGEHELGGTWAVTAE